MATMTLIGLSNLNEHLFDGLQVPEQIDKQTLVNNILMETGNLEVFYTDGDFLQQAIGFWSAARVQSWEKMATVLFEEYEPFINIKRDEVRTITRDLKSESTVQEGVTAWNSASMVDKNKHTGEGKDTGTITEHFHVEGDSAITDAQDVVRNEMEVRMDFNLYNIIVKEFKKEFCLLVY